MIVVLRADAGPAELDAVRAWVEARGLRTHVSRGEQRTIVGCIGDEAQLDEGALRALPGVEEVVPVLRPYKLASKAFAATPTRIPLAEGVVLGGAGIVVIAGPCAVEGRTMLLETADAVRAAGGAALRGGAFKPRTSPYAFQGLGREALALLAEARRRTGLPVVTEVLDPRHVEEVAAVADMLQIGTRNMQNYALLAEVGRVGRPVLLKRGMAATVREFLLAAEYVLAHGNPEVVLCERGIRTFETATRNTFDIAAIPVLKSETHLPVVVDPSHAAGRAEWVAPLAFAAVAAGADGLLIEVHPRPEEARSDGDQSLRLDEFRTLMDRLAAFAAAAGRTIARAPGAAPAEVAA